MKQCPLKGKRVMEMMMTGTDNGVAPPQKISRIARLGEGAALIGIALLLFVVIAALSMALGNDPSINKMLVDEFGPDIAITPFIRAVAMCVILAPLALVIYTLNSVRRLFQDYRSVGILTHSAAARLEKTGWLVMAVPLLTIASTSLAGVLLTLSPLAKGIVFEVDIDESDVFVIVIGLLIVTFGRIHSEAAKIAEENKQII